MKKSVFALLALAALSLGSCGGGEGDNPTTKVGDTTADNSGDRAAEAQKIYAFIPSPKIMAELLMSANVPYRSQLLNNIDNVDKYTSTKQKALNLGVYGADLNYCNVYEKTNETMFYLRATQALAEYLGIENAINENTVTRAEENVDNKDSMSQIISDMFYELEDYLKENEKDDISALLIAGGWVEGLYLAAATIDEKNPNKDIMNHIAEQKYSLEHLVHLLETYPDKEPVSEVHKEILKLKALYDNIKITKEPNVVTEENGVTNIGGGSTIEFTLDQFKELKKTVNEIRNSFIKI